jgi:hypothetical protein
LFQAVGSSVLYVVMHGNKNKEALTKVLSPVLSKLTPTAWSVLNKNIMWNLKRPVWLQGLIDLLEPYVQPVIDEMMDDVESGKSWTLAHVPEAVSRLLTGLSDIACLVPESFYEVRLCKIVEYLVDFNKLLIKLPLKKLLKNNIQFQRFILIKKLVI